MGIVIISAWCIKYERSKVTELWLKCSFGTFMELRMLYSVELDRKYLNSKAKHICCYNDGVKGQIQRWNVNELWLQILFLAIPSSREYIDNVTLSGEWTFHEVTFPLLRFLRVTDSPGTAFMGDASNMRVKGQRSLNFGSKCRFNQLFSNECGVYYIVIWNLVGRR